MAGVEMTGSGKNVSGNFSRISERVSLILRICSHLTFLTEKRMAAQKAEADFFLLLKEHQNDIRKGVSWKEVPFQSILDYGLVSQYFRQRKA